MCLQELRYTMSLFASDRGAVIKAATKRMETAKATLSKAQDEHAERTRQMNLNKAELAYAEEERASLQSQLDVANVNLRASQVSDC